MSPYYEHGGITIYHGDCREVLPRLEKVDAVLTDPPWKASAKHHQHPTMVSPRGITRFAREYGIKYGDIGEFDSTAIEMIVEQCTFDVLILSGYRELGDVLNVMPKLRGVFAWHSPNRAGSGYKPVAIDISFICWGGEKTTAKPDSWPSSLFTHNYPTAGCISTGERILQFKNGPAVHPAQGPLSLYKSLLAPLDKSQVVVDPYVGSGTTLRAAKDLGRKAIGIEIEEKYCEIAAKRLEQEVFEFND